ncbi:MAG: hypothetical protein ACLQVF_21805 [Isosphaeraceae bacterium]
MREYRTYVDSSLRTELEKAPDGSGRKLHASLALLPVDAAQVAYLFDRLLKAAPSDVRVLRDALKNHRLTLTPKLWAELERAKPGDVGLLPSASVLASYAPDEGKWEALADKVARALVSVDAIFLGSWIEALRPVRGKLTGPLATIFQEKEHSESEHKLAISILANYASDDPVRLAELLMVSDPKEYLTLFPVAEKRAERALPIFQAELGKRATYSWNDPPLDPAWTEPGAAVLSRIEAAQGMLSQRFAFCQTMPLDEFLTTAEALRRSGYRPERFRPYANGHEVRVAAVWARDGRKWRISSDLTADEIRQQDGRNTKDKFLPVDVAGYVATGADGKPLDRYAALWVEKSAEDGARLYVGMTVDQETELQDKLKDEKLIPRTMHAAIGSRGRREYCGVWGRPPGAAITGQAYRDQFEGNFEQTQAHLGDQLLIDVAISEASKPQSIRDRAQAAIEKADKKLKSKPDDLDARFSRAMAHFRLGADQKALDDLQTVIAQNPEALSAKQYRVITLAHLGKKQDAQAELAKLQQQDGSESSQLYLAAVAAAELGDGLDAALASLEGALQRDPNDAGLRYDAARACSLASKAIARTDKTKGRRLAERCLQLLNDAVKNDDADFGKMDEEGDLDAIRDDPAFAEIMKAGHADRRYSAIWSNDASFEAVPIYGLDPAAHLAKCRDLVAQGYRPLSCSVNPTTSEGALVTASVWHRPVVSEGVKDRLAERQARTAVALARMGKAEEIWPLLRHSPDPRLRSFIINWLAPLGADAGMVAAELGRRESPQREAGARVSPRPAERGESGRRPGEASRATEAAVTKTVGRSGNPSYKPAEGSSRQPMDTILFNPETSIRRALIMALGTYGPDLLTDGDREPFQRSGASREGEPPGEPASNMARSESRPPGIARADLIASLIDLYRNDPDSGIHSAAEWALRKSGQQAKLKEVDA